MIFIRNDQNISFDFNFSKKELISLYDLLKKDDFVDNIIGPHELVNFHDCS